MITICRYHLIYPRWFNPIIICALTLKAVSSKHKMLSTQDIKFRETVKVQLSYLQGVVAQWWYVSTMWEIPHDTRFDTAIPAELQ